MSVITVIDTAPLSHPAVVHICKALLNYSVSQLLSGISTRQWPRGVRDNLRFFSSGDRRGGGAESFAGFFFFFFLWARKPSAESPPLSLCSWTGIPKFSSRGVVHNWFLQLCFPPSSPLLTMIGSISLAPLQQTHHTPCPLKSPWFLLFLPTLVSTGMSLGHELCPLPPSPC